MREVTCPVYPCVWSVVVNDAVLELAAADIAFRVHLRSHDADEIVAGFEALTAQNTRQLKHLGELNDELHAARKQRDREAKRADEILERMSSENARLRQQRDQKQDVVDAARGVVELLRLLDAVGLNGSIGGPSRALALAVNAHDYAVEVADVRS